MFYIFMLLILTSLLNKESLLLFFLYIESLMLLILSFSIIYGFLSLWSILLILIISVCESCSSLALIIRLAKFQGIYMMKSINLWENK